MDEIYPCKVVVVEGVDPAALLAAGITAPPPAAVEYARAPAAPGHQMAGARSPAAQGGG